LSRLHVESRGNRPGQLEREIGEAPKSCGHFNNTDFAPFDEAVQVRLIEQISSTDLNVRNSSLANHLSQRWTVEPTDIQRVLESKETFDHLQPGSVAER